MQLQNIDLPFAKEIAESLELRTNQLGPYGMHMYMHNPYYSCFSKGHAKFAFHDYKGKRFLVLVKYVNMFGKIYNRLVGVPFCNDKILELDFLMYLISTGEFQDYQFNDGEIEYYNLRKIFSKFTLNNLDYYNKVSDRWAHINKSKWKKNRRIKSFTEENFGVLDESDLGDIKEVFAEWAAWKKENGDFSEKFFLKFFKAIEKGEVNLKDQYKIYGYYHNDKLVYCEVLTQNTPKHWRAEMLFWTQNCPYEVYHHVTSYGHYRRMQELVSLGVEYYYVAGSRDGVKAKTGVLHHKSIFEGNSVNHFRAVL